MTVDRIEGITNSRFKVFIDGQFAFVLYKGELSRYAIREGTEVSVDVYQKIRNEVILKRAKRKAMHLLEQMNRTEGELRNKFKQGFYPEDIAEQAIAYVKAFGYVNDENYARHFVESRMGKKSRMEIKGWLSNKGISSEFIEQAFEECYDSEAEEDAIKELIRKKRMDISTASGEELQKLYGYLARKGFRYDTIRQVIQNYNENT